jgi:two-component system sensor histidine kinase DegS
MALYRVAQESLNNAWKHAPSSSVAVELRYEADSVQLRVSDTGPGFNTQALDEGAERHMGLRGMRERLDNLHGELVIESSEGRGTCITAQLWCSTFASNPRDEVAPV